MRNCRKPDLHINKIYEIDIEKLKNKNIKAVIFDLDNTLVSEETVYPTDKLKFFLNVLKNNGINVGVVSNNRKERVELFMKELDIPYLYEAKKPSRKKWKRC